MNTVMVLKTLELKKGPQERAKFAAQVEARLWLTPNEVSLDEITAQQQAVWGVNDNVARELGKLIIRGLQAHRDKLPRGEYLAAKAYYLRVFSETRKASNVAVEPIALAEQTWWAAHDRLTDTIQHIGALSHEHFFKELHGNNSAREIISKLRRTLQLQCAFLLGVESGLSKKCANYRLQAILYYTKIRYFESLSTLGAQETYDRDQRTLVRYLTKYYQIISS